MAKDNSPILFPLSVLWHSHRASRHKSCLPAETRPGRSAFEVERDSEDGPLSTARAHYTTTIEQKLIFPLIHRPYHHLQTSRQYNVARQPTVRHYSIISFGRRDFNLPGLYDRSRKRTRVFSSFPPVLVRLGACKAALIPWWPFKTSRWKRLQVGVGDCLRSGRVGYV